jgi:hypothetical protein
MNIGPPGSVSWANPVTTMKTTTLALAAVLAAFGATAAHAENRFSVAIGVNNPAPYYQPAAPGYYGGAPGYYSPAPAYVEPNGHWENVTVRTWVPDRWVESRNYWGRPVRSIEPGHYILSTNRVWVEGRHEYRDRGYGNGYGYSYGRRDDRDDHRRNDYDRDHDGDRDHDRR